MAKKDNTKTEIGILGFGEVGQAIAKFYQSSRVKDLNRNDGLENVEILHVCIPWSKKFISIVKQEIEVIKPSLTIIHSTVPVGTTQKIISGLSQDCREVVHSPIRGIHPNLYGGIKTFVKYVGADNEKAGKMAKRHLEGLGIKTEICKSSKTTEALKLWDTTQYAWQILLNKDIKKWCEKNGVDFEIVYTKANTTYNEGYQKLGKSEVVRPYLKYVSGPIGGHCLIPNCQILNSETSKIVLKKNNLFRRQKLMKQTYLFKKEQ